MAAHSRGALVQKPSVGKMPEKKENNIHVQSWARSQTIAAAPLNADTLNRLPFKDSRDMIFQTFLYSWVLLQLRMTEFSFNAELFFFIWDLPLSTH